MKQLFTPLLYLKIKHPSKPKFDFWLPALLALLTTGVFYFSDPLLESTLSERGLLSSLMRLLQILAGFFIASLAAIATFMNASIDKPLQGHSVTLRHHSFKNEPETLSRRRFLTFLFGYLSFSTVMIYLSLTSIGIFDSALNKIFNITNDSATILSWAMFGFFSFWFYNILVATLLGLHYLTERIHRPEQTSGPKPS